MLRPDVSTALTISALTRRIDHYEIDRGVVEDIGEIRRSVSHRMEGRKNAADDAERLLDETARRRCSRRAARRGAQPHAQPAQYRRIARHVAFHVLAGIAFAIGGPQQHPIVIGPHAVDQNVVQMLERPSRAMRVGDLRSERGHQARSSTCTAQAEP